MSTFHPETIAMLQHNLGKFREGLAEIERERQYYQSKADEYAVSAASASARIADLENLLAHAEAANAEESELAEARTEVEQAAASPLSSTPLAVAFGAAVPAQRDGEQADGGEQL